MRQSLPKNTTIVVVNDFDYVQGGASKVALDTAKFLYEKGYRVIFFSGTHRNNEYLNVGYENFTLALPECLCDKNKVRGALRGLYNFKASKEFKNLLKSLDPKTTIIHIHGWTKTLSSSIFKVAFRMNFKIILTMHDYFSVCPNGGFFNYKKCSICKLKPLSYQCILTNCDSRNYFFKLYRIFRQLIQSKLVKLDKCLNGVIYVSDFSYKIINQYFPQSYYSKIVYNPLAEEKKEYSTFSDCSKKYILYVGRISKEKGIDLLCKAVSQLNYPMKVIGNGPLLNELKNRYPNIDFLGWKHSDELTLYYQNAHFFVFPSLWYETAGLTILEAAKNNLYSLVSDSSASVEFVCRYSVGELFSSGNVDDLKLKIKKLYNQPKKNIKKNAEKIENDLLPKKYLKKILEVYYCVLSGGKL